MQTDKKTIVDKQYEVNMTTPAMREYVIRTDFGSLSGKIAIFIALFALLQLVATIDKPNYYNSRVILIGVIIIIVILKPLFLIFRAYSQVKMNPFYKKPLVYSFKREGMMISQDEKKEEVLWEKVYKVIKTNKIMAIYTSKVHAFVLPLEELGSDATKIAATIVQCLEPYNPRLSKNLKELKSGNGIKRIK